MAFSTPNMSLMAWNNASDPYDHDELSDNFLKLDQHDHSVGKGVQIGTGGIADHAITEDKIYPGSLGAGALADDSITERKLNPYIVPVGMVTPWWRPNTTYPVPVGWQICDGRTISVGEHSFDVAGSIVLPDLRNKFILGALETGGSSDPTPTQSPSIGASPSRLHTEDISHSHQVSSHTHWMNLYHEHSGRIWGGVAEEGYPQQYEVTVGVIGSQSPGSTALAPGSGWYVTKSTPNRSGWTVGSSYELGTQSTTNSAGAQTLSTSDSIDRRGQFVGLLVIMKVKHGA